MKKVLALSFNSPYFRCGKSLIASVHRTSYHSVDEIIVYNLGLTSAEIDFLNHCEKVKVIDYPEAVKTFFPEYLEPKQYAWKPMAIKDAEHYGNLIFYLDSCITVLKNLSEIYTIIEQEEIFLVQDNHLNITWTHPRALELLQATEREKYGKQLSAGILGYKKGGKFQCLIDEGFDYSKNPEIIRGDHRNHRHDQSIYSILAIRYNCPVQSIHKYGEFAGIKSPEQVIYVHRGCYFDETGLRMN